MLAYEFDHKHPGMSGFIIGGGPSLQPYIHHPTLTTALQSQITFGVNRAYEWFHQTYLVIGDMWFWKTYLSSIKQVSSIKLVPEFCPKDHATDVVHIKRSFDKKQLVTESFKQPLCFLNNTGLAALRVAYVMGCNPLYLLGMDLRVSEKTHWHSGYTEARRNPPQARYRQFQDLFSQTILLMQQRGRTIISCSSVSSLNSLIPYQSLEDILCINL